MASLKFITPLFMAAAAATAFAVAPVAAAESFAVATGSSITQFAPEDDPGGPGGSGCTTDGTCGSGSPAGGSGCTAAGACGSGGPWGGQGCVPGVGCFNWRP